MDIGHSTSSSSSSSSASVPLCLCASVPSHCELCPHRCGVDRLEGQTGYCGAGPVARVFRYGPHHGEEPPVSGERGSGTVFFSRCTLRCLYCQNYPWSQEGQGDEYTPGELTDVLLALADAGCHNWNLVSPTPWLPMISEALDGAKRAGVSLPVVYNTSGFERIEVLRELGDRVDVYLADLRYSRAETAHAASGSREYVDVARAALMEMWRRSGPLRIGDDGTAAGGTICRLLVLPGRAEEASENLRWVADEIGTDISISLMAQYLPAYRAGATPGWDRRISRAEYDGVRETMEDLGFSDGWIQELADEPPADLAGFRMQPGAADAPRMGDRA